MDELRVSGWADFIGQNHLKERLEVHISACKKQKRTLDHIFLAGPPGFGKTSLATIIAQRADKKFLTHTMPLSERALVGIVRDFQGVLLLDEIHRAPTKDQEALLSLLEFGWVQNGRGIKTYATGLTIIGATTEPKKVIEPLYDRFAIKPDFDDYTDIEMGMIVTSMAGKAKVVLSEEDAQILGRATGNTPRKARQFVLAARDLACTKKKKPTAQDILAFCRVDNTGITFQHMQYLNALNELGGLAGLIPLRNMLNVNDAVVRDLERLLLKQKLVVFTERGRELTGRGQEKIRAS